MDAQKIVKTWKNRIAKAGMDQKTFAERIGMSRGHLCEILSGKKNPTIELFDRIEKILKAYQ